MARVVHIYSIPTFSHLIDVFKFNANKMRLISNSRRPKGLYGISISKWCRRGQFLKIMKCKCHNKIEANINLMVQLDERPKTTKYYILK
jgi:hypothetical protein